MPTKDKEGIIASIVDILYAYHYDLRMRSFSTQEFSSETNLNLVRLSSTLSAFIDFNQLKDASQDLKLKAMYIGSIRRSLVFTLYRNYDLALKVMEDLIEQTLNIPA